MADRSQRLGLFWAILGTFTIALLVLMAVLFVLVPQQADEYLTNTLRERGWAVAKEIERRVLNGTAATPESSSAARIDAIVFEVPEVLQALVVVCARECRSEDVVAQRSSSDPEVTERVLREFNRAHRPPTLQIGSELLMVASQVGIQSGTANTYVVVLLDRANINQGRAELRRTLLFALLASMITFMALVGVLTRVWLLRPIRMMRAMAAQLSEADLSGRVDVGGTRELGELAGSLNSIGQGLRDTLGRVRGVAESVAHVIDQISRSASSSSSGSATVLTRVEETSSAMVQMLASLKGIAENVEVLYQSAEESSSSILEMATTNDEVAENVTKMAASVEQTTGAIEQMTFSTREVARNLEDLLKSSEGTSNSIREMDVAIGQVETNAYETARLSEQVSKDAESGMESIQKTIAGIDKIKDSSRSASTVIEQLGRRIQEIGNIVDVIDEVAEQTNLLALNAAIIAAQAGEHGKGFAVVAEEIKDLAERTGSSTKEIGDLIRSVQGESRNAVSAMNQGVRSVEDGVLLGREAEGALKKIQESASRSTQMVKAIARATVEQARGSKEVTGSVERIRETVAQISKATTEQARGSEQIMKSADHMKSLTMHVTRSVHEQAHGSRQISRSIESINEMVTHLNRAQKEQTRGSEQVLQAVEAIKSVADSQNRSVKGLEEAIETLRKQAEVLRGEIRRFRV